MDSLETQVGQIYINNKRLSKSFVSLFSEKIAETQSEIFILMEIPPSPAQNAVNPEYEKIAKSFTAILRRNFRKPNPNSFENSIAQANNELAKLAESGNTAWVGKLNTLLTVRQNDDLYVATTGKIHAYLFRDKQFSDIADSPAKPNPLKTFENFAIGKVKKGDILILSTAQMFNYLSIERLQKILNDLPIGAACATIADEIKNLADESVSFGTLILELGFNTDFVQQDAEKIVNAAIAIDTTIADKIGSVINPAKKFIGDAILATKNSRVSNIKNINAEIIKEHAKQYTDLKKIKELPKVKKFFLIAASIFIILLAVNIVIANKLHAKKILQAQVNAKLADIQNKINDANTALIFNDPNSALKSVTDAQAELNTLPKDPQYSNKENVLAYQITGLEQTINHVKKVPATRLLSYTGANNISRIILANRNLYLIDMEKGSFDGYDLNGHTVGKEFITANNPINAIFAANNIITYTDVSGGLYQLNIQTLKLQKQKGSLTPNSIGLVLFGTPAKAYSISGSQNNITANSLNSLAAPINYLKQPADFSKATDLAIDGSIYALEKNGIQKFSGNNSKQFNIQPFSFGDGAKIYTSKNSSSVYVLDPLTQKLYVFDKKGNITGQYTSDQFTKLKDFIIDEQNKIAYILNDNAVWIIHL